MTTNVTIDYMHGVLLGVCKKLLELWFDSKYKTEHWYIGDKMRSIDSMLKAVSPPYFIHRRPRILSNTYSHWKASELRNWLLFYSLPCLKEHLSHTYLVHFSCLVEAIYILQSEGISSSDFTRAETLLNAFCSNMSTLYGNHLMSLNVHNLTHLTSFVKLWGPLWCWSCFAFESFNGEIKKCIHGTGNVCREVFWFLQAQKRVTKKVYSMQDDGNTESKAYKFMERMVTSSKKSGVGAYQCKVIKVQDLQVELDQVIKEKLKKITNSECKTDFSLVAKVARNGFTMFSKACSKVKKQNSFCIMLEKPTAQVDAIEVHKFIMHNDTVKVFAVGRLMKMAESILDRRVPHLQRMTFLRYGT